MMEKQTFISVCKLVIITKRMSSFRVPFRCHMKYLLDARKYDYLDEAQYGTGTLLKPFVVYNK